VRPSNINLQKHLRIQEIPDQVLPGIGALFVHTYPSYFRAPSKIGKVQKLNATLFIRLQRLFVVELAQIPDFNDVCFCLPQGRTFCPVRHEWVNNNKQGSLFPQNTEQQAYGNGLWTLKQ
jgi:hypothetical protein